MDWFRCRVLRCGPASDEDRVYFRLVAADGKFPGPRWVFSSAPDRREMLATALTAVSLALPVDVNMELGAHEDDYKSVVRMYLVRD